MNTQPLNEHDVDWNQLIKDLDANYISNQEALTISNISTSGNPTGNLASQPFIYTSDTWHTGLSVQGDINVSPHHDINLGDISLKAVLANIQDRLNILQPNPNLEREWDELRELGQRYRALEQEILDKQQVWNALKKRTGPEIT